jgi:hypothetical protein
MIYKRIVFIPIELLTLYFCYHIKCILFNQWIQVLSRERKQVPLLCRCILYCTTVRSFSDTYICRLPTHSKRAWPKRAQTSTGTPPRPVPINMTFQVDDNEKPVQSPSVFTNMQCWLKSNHQAISYDTTASVTLYFTPS